MGADSLRYAAGSLPVTVFQGIQGDQNGSECLVRVSTHLLVIL
jgi:hypothetical protein